MMSQRVTHAMRASKEGAGNREDGSQVIRHAIPNVWVKPGRGE